MAFSEIGLIWAYTILISISLNYSIGILFLYKSKKTNARLLGYFGLYAILAALCGTGTLIDIFSIFLTGSNAENPNNFISVMNYIWLVPSGLMIMIISAEIVLPNKKWIIIGSYILIAIVFEVLILINPNNSFSAEYPQIPGETVIYEYLVLESLAGIFYLIGILYVALFGVLGFLIKGIKSTGILKKKLFRLSTGLFAVLMMNTLMQMQLSVLFNVFLWVGNIFAFYIMYIGLREETEKVEIAKDDVKVEGELFRIATTRPKKITEEEVSIYKEKKICLVCKGSASKFTYICNNCEALYCHKCAETLSNLENQCWVCDVPIDDTKPVKHQEPNEKELEIKSIKEKLK